MIGDMNMKYQKVIALMMLAACVTLAGCSDYEDSYDAFCHVKSFTDDSAEISFGSFEGTEAVKIGDDDGGCCLEYNAKLDKGSLTVYYDNDGTKKELFKLSSGEDIDSKLELDAGPVNIIIETDEKCEEGSFEFNIK